MDVDILCPTCSGRQKRIAESTLRKGVFCPICGEVYFTCKHNRFDCLVAFMECDDMKRKRDHAGKTRA